MSVLRNIIRHKQEEVARQKQRVPQALLTERVKTQTRDFLKALILPGLSLIAEVKYRSPSTGVLLDQRSPVTRARSYEAGGARALSVLTDHQYFGGTCDDLTAIRAHTKVPVLRKDFIIDEYQIYESRAIGADAILLIVRLLDERQLARFIKIAQELAMVCLVEVHTEEDVAVACRVHAQCIGVNNRDLDTLKTNITWSLRMKPLIPPGYVTVAESGIRTRDAMVRLEAAGYDAVLVGHALADSRSAANTMRALQGR